MKMVCSRCLSNRGEFMREYRKLVDKLVGITKKKASKWWKKSEFISVGNGVHRLRKQDCSIEIDETNRMIVADTD